MGLTDHLSYSPHPYRGEYSTGICMDYMVADEGFKFVHLPLVVDTHPPLKDELEQTASTIGCMYSTVVSIEQRSPGYRGGDCKTCRKSLSQRTLHEYYSLGSCSRVARTPYTVGPIRRFVLFIHGRLYEVR